VTWGYPDPGNPRIAGFIATSSLGAINPTTTSLAFESGCFVASGGYETGYNLNQVTSSTAGRMNTTTNQTFVSGVQSGGNASTPMSMNCEIVDNSSSSSATGRASVRIVGGLRPFTVSVNRPLGATAPVVDRSGRSVMIQALSPGTYNVTIRDGNGCEENCSFLVPMTTDTEGTPTTDACGAGVSIGRPLNNGECGALWEPTEGLVDATSSITEVELSPGQSGTYTLTTSDGEGNIVSEEVYEAIVSDEITVEIFPNTTQYCGGDLVFESEISNVNDVSYLWSVPSGLSGLDLTSAILNIPSEVMEQAPPQPNGIMQVELSVLHPLGCEGFVSSSVSLSSQLNVQISGDLGLCKDESSVLTSIGGDAYLWNTGETSASITVSDEGIYEVTVTDGHCVGQAYVAVSQGITGDEDGDGVCDEDDDDPGNPCLPPPMNLQIGGNSSPCNGDPAVVSLVIQGGTEPYSIVWKSGDGGFENTETDTYSITLNSPFDYWNLLVTDANGCESTANGVVNYSNAPDTDGDGVCDDNDNCAPDNPNVAPGLPCSDNNPCTKNDKYNNDCQCQGVLINNCDCSNLPSPCDDNNDCTYSDHFDENCNCVGYLHPDCIIDLCDPNNPNIYPGRPCNDANDCTKNDMYNMDCHCQGTPIYGCDPSVVASPCNDNNDCTFNDHFDENGNCQGTLVPNCDEASDPTTLFSNCIHGEAQQDVNDLQEYFAPNGLRVHLSGEDYPLTFYNTDSPYPGALAAYRKNGVVYLKYPKVENGPFLGYVKSELHDLPDQEALAESNLANIINDAATTSYSVIIADEESSCSVSTNTVFGSNANEEQIFQENAECDCSEDTNNEDLERELTLECLPTQAKNTLTNSESGLNRVWLTPDGYNITLLLFCFTIR